MTYTSLQEFAYSHALSPKKFESWAKKHKQNLWELTKYIYEGGFNHMHYNEFIACLVMDKPFNLPY